jgi:hypothetical protein
MRQRREVNARKDRHRDAPENGVPDPDLAIDFCRGEHASVGASCQTVDLSQMTAKRSNLLDHVARRVIVFGARDGADISNFAIENRRRRKSKYTFAWDETRCSATLCRGRGSRPFPFSVLESQRINVPSAAPEASPFSWDQTPHQSRLHRGPTLSHGAGDRARIFSNEVSRPKSFCVKTAGLKKQSSPQRV